MRTTDRSLHDIDPGTIEQWKHLCDTAIAPNPFADPRFLLASAATHSRARTGRVTFVHDDGAIIGALSYTPALHKIGPVRLRSVSTSESFTAYEGERHHPLIAPGRAEDVFAALIDGAETQRAHLLELGRVPMEGHLAEALLSAASSRRVPVLVEEELEFVSIGRASLSTDDDGSVFAWGHLTAGSRKKLRRLVRNLQRDHGDLELLDESRDPGAIDRFLELQSAGWKGDGAKDGKAFERTGLDTWFRAVTEAFGNDQRLSVLTLRTPSRTVFSTVVLHSGSSAFGFHDAFAEEFAPFSPGKLGRLAEMKALLSTEGVEVFDPSMDDQLYPQALSLYPDRRRYASYTLGVYGLGRHAIRHLPRARRVRDRLRGARG